MIRKTFSYTYNIRFVNGLTLDVAPSLEWTVECRILKPIVIGRRFTLFTISMCNVTTMHFSCKLTNIFHNF
ncbi:hypothetical protein ACI65C_012319 [Semiaphis heraclei]